MRKLFLPTLLLCSALAAQEHPLPVAHREPPYDVAPSFPGGSEAMYRYFADSLRYPEPERSKGKQGNVLVAFTVDVDGTIRNLRGVNGVPGAPGLMREAFRLLEHMPLWEPARKNGHPVAVEVNTSIPFRLRRR